MNEIKQQLLTEIKKRTDGSVGKDIPLKKKEFPVPINKRIKRRGDIKSIDQKLTNAKEKGFYRGKIKSAILPTTYVFKPTEFKKDKSGGITYSGNKEAGVHQYTVTGDDSKIEVSIKHTKSKKPQLKKGSLTTSQIDINFGGDNGTREALDSVIPALKHHIKAIGPDTINFKTKDMKEFHAKVVKAVSKKYRINSKELEDGTSLWTLQSKSITPKIQSLINTLIKK